MNLDTASRAYVHEWTDAALARFRAEIDRRFAEMESDRRFSAHMRNLYLLLALEVVLIAGLFLR